ncbi:retrovirus-related pol polyprotein from transposon TNT 1-94 [Tanacetum coccineum]|uniref:Retrovirus-related pol polyprotein from transposon TNT 1-94 n=1 Tax=Tanacetum coccineum TaxID=301880 RepID=A0ABQ5BGW2_9ASTR
MRLKQSTLTWSIVWQKTVENTNTLRGFVQCARTQNPSEPLLDSACMFTKHVQEFNISKHNDSLKTKDSNKRLLTSTRVKPTTSASKSKPSSNTKNNRITRPPSSNQKNNVEDHSRKVKSSLNKTYSVSEPVSNALVKHYVRNANFESICAICNKCLFDANHDMCIIDYVNDVTIRSKSKSKRNKMRKVWKPTSKVFSKIGYSWKPTGRTFTIVRNRLWRLSNRKRYNISGLLCGRVMSQLILRGLICDYELKVAFRKHTCFIRDLDGVDLLKGSRDSNLYTLSIDNLLLSSPIFRGLLKLKYQKDYLCSTCALGKSKKHTHKPKAEDSIQEKLYLLHMDLWEPMRVQSIDGREYILVIIDDFSRFTWVKFLHSKDEVLEFVIKFLKMIQVRLNATLHNIRTDNDIEFINQKLRDYYEEVRISHQASFARTLQ